MKKVFLAIGVISFLLVGAISVETVNANQTDSSVYDDPPKKSTSKKGSCADYKKSSCCKASASKDPNCDDKGSKASASTDTGKSETSSVAKKSEEETPDKK